MKELGFDPRKLGPDSPLLAKSKPSGPRRQGEHLQQVALFTWAAAHGQQYPQLRWMFAVPNFSGRFGKMPPVAALKHAANLKAEGRKPGVLDVWLPVRVGCYPGLVIEMKYGSNTLTDEQREWKLHLELEGWLVFVDYSADAAIAHITDYLEGRLG